jgi:hypothetical protein
VVIWYTFPHFGMLYQEKSGNSDVNRFLRHCCSLGVQSETCLSTHARLSHKTVKKSWNGEM